MTNNIFITSHLKQEGRIMYRGNIQSFFKRLPILAIAVLSITAFVAHGATSPASAVKTAVSTAAKTAKTAANAKAATTAKKTAAAATKQAAAKQAPAPKKQKKKVKIRSFVVDTKVIAWGRTASDASSYATQNAMRVVGNKGNFLIKDAVLVSDPNGTWVCILRVNFKDEMPETWYLETEMCPGFGSTYERAYNNALQKSISKVKTRKNTADWATAQSASVNSSEQGLIPYEITFASVGREKCCRLYFRYFMPRK